MTAPALAKTLHRPLRQRIETRLARIGSWLSRLRVGQGRTDYRYVFIVTYGRTGSTLLQKVIGGLPGHYMAGENYNALFGAYISHRNAKVLARKYGPGFQKRDHPWHGACAADPDAFARTMVAGFVRTILRPPRGAQVVGFKEIRYLDILDDLEDYLLFMAEFFPGAVFVVNTRAPQDVSRSSWWQEQDPAALATRIARFEDITTGLVHSLPDRFTRIAYEDWTRDAEALRPVFALLGQPFDRAYVDEILGVRLTHVRYSAVTA